MGFTIRFITRGVRETERPISFIPKGALTHHPQSGLWYPSRWSGSCALHELSFSQFSRGGRKCRRLAFPVQSAVVFAVETTR